MIVFAIVRLPIRRRYLTQLDHSACVRSSYSYANITIIAEPFFHSFAFIPISSGPNSKHIKC